MNEPTTIIAGNTYEWYATSGDKTPEEGYTLEYVLTGPSTGSITGSTYDTQTFYVKATATFTAALTAGTYTMYGLLSDGTDRFTYSTTVLDVKANPATAGAGYDARSHARRTLDLIKTAIENITPDGVVSLSIAGRSKTNYSIGELLKLKSYYEAEVEREAAEERISKGMTGKSQIYLRFQ